jgi:excinuclease UvrABC helicase subunit UvrB
MREAATNLEFEKVARLRDEFKQLHELELDTQEGRAGD